jgi:ubiquinone/menaquinone biosynthesis C-methylase UbiE
MIVSAPSPKAENQPFDRKLLRIRRNRASDNIEQHAFLLELATENILGRITDIKRNFPCVLHMGSRCGNKYDKQLIEICGAKELIYTDISENMLKKSEAKEGKCVQIDEEFIPFADNSFDLIISPLDLHMVNDLPGALAQIKRIIKPDGTFIAAMLGGCTLNELRQSISSSELSLYRSSSPRVAPFADKQQIGALLQRSGYALPVVDSDIITATYNDLNSLMHDLRGMGESNLLSSRSRIPGTKSLMKETEKFYKENYTDDTGRIVATYEIIYLIGWRPHASQQQPLRPGSAEKSLIEALGNEE